MTAERPNPVLDRLADLFHVGYELMKKHNDMRKHMFLTHPLDGPAVQLYADGTVRHTWNVETFDMENVIEPNDYDGFMEFITLISPPSRKDSAVEILSHVILYVGIFMIGAVFASAMFGIRIFLP